MSTNFIINNKLNNLDGMGQFLEKCKLPKFTEEERGHSNRPISTKNL